MQGMLFRYAEIRLGRLVLWAQVLFFVFASFAFSQEPDSPPDVPQITLLDGKVQPAPNLKVAAGAVTAEGLPSGTTIDDLRLIQVHTAPAPPATDKPAYVIDLVGGGSIGASQVTIADDQCTIAWSAGEPLKVPIDALRAIRFQPTVPSDEFSKALAAPAADVDRIFVKIDGKIDSVTGLVNKLSETEISLEIDGQLRNLPRDRIYGVVVALAAPETRLPRCTFQLRDGSVIGGDLVALNGNKAQIQIAGNSQVSLPWDTVQRVVVRSSRVLYLSDVKPSAVKQQTFVTLIRPWQRDRSVTGKPLTLGETVYEKGIGVQSQAALTFDVPDDFDALSATIGIDADANGKGDCVCEVLVDGQRVFSERIRGSEGPKELQIPLMRAKQITLVVLPGADLDLADHADWADIRLLKNKK
jgi:hypothetical protein